jgi:alpha-N-arabinofuranosidase
MSNTSAPARILIDPHRTIGEISPNIFGGFVEHLGRCVYEGIYDPASPHADEAGLRRDVMAALREMNCPVMRYPGGNFVSGYDWLDGVGPKNDRPRRKELAWHSIETNQFGTNEFVGFCKKINTEPMMGMNFGTGSIDSARALVEYCNSPVGTKWADLRAKHGFKDPHNVKYWCLGNEMDGPWQIGALDAVDYAKKAREAAKIMKWTDPSIQLIACGSSTNTMTTFPDWDRTVLEMCYPHVDYLSMHYYANNKADDTASFLAIPVALEAFVDDLAAVARVARSKNRGKKHVHLSWDEWNVWYQDTPSNGQWTEAPHLLEEVYNLEDALVVAQWMSVFLRKCDVVKMACLAQVVNVIAPILTTRDGLLKQSIYYPFVLFRKFAAGSSLDLLVSSPKYESKTYGDVSVLDVSASFDPATGKSAIFLVNRSQTDSVPVDLVWQDGAPTKIAEAHQISGTDPKAENTWENPSVVVSKPIAAGTVKDGNYAITLPPLSFTVVACEGKPL